MLPGRLSLSPQVTAPTLQHHKRLQNTRVPLCLSCLHRRTCGQKSTLKSIQSSLGFKTNKTTCVCLTWGFYFPWVNVKIISTFKEGVNKGICVSVHQEIPCDVFYKNGQQPGNWQMRTCWSTSPSPNNTLSTLSSLHSLAQITHMCLCLQF